MIRLLFALLLALSAPSWAASTQCSDGSYVDSTVYPAACGANPSGINISLATSSALTFTATTDLSSGTAYLSGTLSATSPTWHAIRAGTLDECSVSDAVSSTTITLTCSGLSATTTYCGHLTHIVAGVPSRVDYVCGSTAATPPVGGGGGVEITAAARFVGTGGSDGASGLSNAARWLNPPTTALPTSVDLWFLDGSDFAQKQSPIAWNGVPADWVRVGTYCMDGSTPREYPFGGCVKAEFVGWLVTASFATGQNNYSAATMAAANTSEYDSYLSVTGDYVEVNDIITRNAANGILVRGNNTHANTHHVIIQDNEAYNIAFTSFAGFDGVQDIAFKRNIADYGGTCMQQRVYGFSHPIGTTPCTIWTGAYMIAGIHGSAALPVRALFEGNIASRGLTEGFNCLRTRYMIVRGNKASQFWSGAIYCEASADVVVENNILVGSKKDIGYVSGAIVADWTSMALSSEDYNLPQSIVNQTGYVYRNNLTVDLGDGFILGLEAATEIASPQRKIGVRYYHNTHISSIYSEAKSSAASATITLVDVQNNLFWNTGLSASQMCVFTSFTNVTFADNAWTTNPSQAGCDGAGDEYGTLGIGTLAYSDWNLFDADDMPEFADAAPNGALPASATKLTTAILDKDNFGFAYEQMAEILNSTMTEANWECAACLTATNLVRNATTPKGAMGQ